MVRPHCEWPVLPAGLTMSMGSSPTVSADRAPYLTSVLMSTPAADVRQAGSNHLQGGSGLALTVWHMPCAPVQVWGLLRKSVAEGLLCHQLPQVLCAT